MQYGHYFLWVSPQTQTDKTTAKVLSKFRDLVSCPHRHLRQRHNQSHLLSAVDYTLRLHSQAHGRIQQPRPQVVQVTSQRDNFISTLSYDICTLTHSVAIGATNDLTLAVSSRQDQGEPITNLNDELSKPTFVDSSSPFKLI